MQLSSFLRANVDTKLLPTYQPNSQSASMARTSDNHSYDRNSNTFRPSRGRGGGNRGRGTKGRGRGYTGKSSSRSERGTERYIKTQDEDGNLLVAKPINNRTSKPCFNKIQFGRCDRQGCSFNHSFKIIETSAQHEPRQKSTNRNSSQENKYDARNPNWQKEAEGADTDLDEQSNLVSTPTPSIAIEDHSHQEDVEPDDQEYSFFNSYADAHSSLNDIGPNLACHAPEASIGLLSVLLLFMVLPARLTLSSLSVLVSALWTAAVSALQRCIKTLFKMSSTSAWFLLSVYFRCFSQRCAVAAEANKYQAQMPIILDSGATMAMSGDLSLFIRSSMVPISSHIALAQQGSTAKGTHIGKISIHGKVIDCLYVPSFKQTLLSLGYFLNLGMTSSTSTKGDLTIYTPDNTTYLKFRLSSNNLFYLNTDTHQSA